MSTISKIKINNDAYSFIDTIVFPFWKPETSYSKNYIFRNPNEYNQKIYRLKEDISNDYKIFPKEKVEECFISDIINTPDYYIIENLLDDLTYDDIKEICDSYSNVYMIKKINSINYLFRLSWKDDKNLKYYFTNIAASSEHFNLINIEISSDGEIINSGVSLKDHTHSSFNISTELNSDKILIESGDSETEINCYSIIVPSKWMCIE